MQHTQEYILCAAIWYDDKKKRSHLPFNIESGIVASGWRHHNCYTVLWALFPDASYEQGHTVQGFLTSRNRFVDREEAQEIAFCAGQILDTKQELRSEDLY